MTGKAEQKSRKEKRKEARSEKQKLRFLSWVQHQGGKNKKPAMPSVESSPVEEKKPKKEPTAVMKRKREREERRKPKSKFQEYLEMEMGGAVSREEDLETEKRLAKMLKVKKGKLGGPDDGMDSLFADLGFGGDFGSDDETKEYDWKVADDTKLDKKKRKRKNKKVKNDAMEEPDDGGMEMAEENDGELHESEDREPNVIELPTESKARYVPPSLRATSKSESEEISQMRRRVRGLLNRLSESNVESITQEIAALFRSVPRSAGCQIIGDEVLASCSRGPRGNEQYAAVFAAFVAGMACLVGMDFSAKILASLAKSFEDEYSKEDGLSLRNLTLLFCYLCIFDVVSSDLVYDLLSVLSKRLTELDVSTVLTILQCCGMKLRGDDPGAMKDFILGIQNSVNQLKSHSAGQEDGKAEIHSKRMEFMLDTICDIKNNKKRPKEDPSHHTRIKKWLQKLKAEDVLLRGIKWSKLLDPEKKGQWWLSGDVSSTVGNIEDVAAVISKDVVEAQKLVQLAAAQRMNTDLRRAIFCIIMSAEDYVDAFEKLLRLDLSGKQDREIIRVIVDCCLQEKVFNKYYTVLASKLCSHDKNHKFSLQYCLWDHFKELDTMDLNRSMNLANLVAEMLANFTLSLATLKVVNLANPMETTPKRIMHFRMLFETLLKKDDALVWNVFTRIAGLPELEILRDGIVLFIKQHVVAKDTGKDLAGKFKIAKKALANAAGVLMHGLVASVRTCELAAARDAYTVNSLQQGKRQALTNETHILTKIIDNSTSCSTSLGGRPDCGIDNDSHGYVQDHDKDGTKSRGRCPTAKKLFADTTAEEGESNNRCFARLSYIESQEPGDLSQANALEVVDRLISINGGVSSQEPTPNKLETAKPPISSKRGTLILAEKVDRSRSSNGRAEIFAWVDSREDDGGGDFFSKNKDILLRKSAGRGKSKSHFPRAKRCSTKIAPGENKIGECKNRINSKLCGGFETLSDSRLLKSDVKSKRASGKRTKKNLLKDLDDVSNARSSEEQQEKVSVALHDVGLDTQMALEAIEALAQCSPAKILSAKGEPPLDREMRDEKSKIAKSHSKNSPPQNRISGIQEGVTTRSKRRKVTELNPKPQKERNRGSKMQENSKDLRAKAKDKEAKSVPEKGKVSKIFLDGNKYHGTPVAHRTRHCGKNNLYEYTELCSVKHLKRGMNLTGDISTIVEVQNNHIANEPAQSIVSETKESGSNYVEKESTEHTCADNAQNIQQCRDESTHRTSANIAQNLYPCIGEPTTDVAGREPPKQRRTPTAMVQSKAPAVTQTATDHEITPEVARPSKKRRVFIRSVSELLKYAKRETSNGRSTSMLSSIIAKSLAASPILNSSIRVDSKTSGFSSSGQRQKEPSNADDTSKSPKSNSQVQNSALKTPSKVIHELSPTFSPRNPSKASSRSLSKPSVAIELLKLDHENVLSNRQLKDSGRRKDMTSSSILFSHHLDQDVIKHQKKILARLGVREAFSMSDATHFVADSFFRTKNMLEAIALGKLVVTSMWLERCGQAGCFIDDNKYILRDAKKEREIGFSMPISLASACKHPLLLGKRVFVTPNVKPSREVVTSLVSASSGQPLERIGRSITKEKEVPDDLLVISCEQDYETVEPLLERGASVFDTELVLNGIIIQKLEYERHRLFSDRVKQTRSTRWLKDAARGRFVPVSKCP